MVVLQRNEHDAKRISDQEFDDVAIITRNLDDEIRQFADKLTFEDNRKCFGNYN